ncbi:MAG: hypothetical protein PHR35_16655 [Kiritimatiellae bacterium]|nr:hypothetical protein [Kiritimatiellia bacterium]
MHAFRKTAAAVLTLCGLGGAMPAPGAESSAPRLWAAAGYWGGDATYSIGGRVVMDGETMQVHDPLSELKFPVEAASFGGGADIPLGRRAELRLSAFGIGSSDSGTVENRDWLEPGVLWVESESDASLSGYSLNGDCVWWFDLNGPTAMTPIQFGVGGGVFYQSLSWDVENLDQWYPLEPGLPHAIEPGLVATYELDVLMPYLELALRAQFERVRCVVSAGLAPYVGAEDEDDHMLRGILARTDADGVGGLGEARLEYDLTPQVFLQLRGNVFGFVADGTEKDRTYAGPDAGSTWTIEHEIDVFQYQIAVAVGMAL